MIQPIIEHSWLSNMFTYVKIFIHTKRICLISLKFYLCAHVQRIQKISNNKLVGTNMDNMWPICVIIYSLYFSATTMQKYIINVFNVIIPSFK